MMRKLSIMCFALCFAGSAFGADVGGIKLADKVAIGGQELALNGAARGTIPGAAFNTALTKIWLGDKPVQAELKKAMLGG